MISCSFSTSAFGVALDPQLLCFAVLRFQHRCQRREPRLDQGGIWQRLASLEEHAAIIVAIVQSPQNCPVNPPILAQSLALAAPATSPVPRAAAPVAQHSGESPHPVLAARQNDPSPGACETGTDPYRPTPGSDLIAMQPMAHRHRRRPRPARIALSHNPRLLRPRPTPARHPADHFDPPKGVGLRSTSGDPFYNYCANQPLDPPLGRARSSFQMEAMILASASGMRAAS
jgi:hypothetical protein